MIKRVLKHVMLLLGLFFLNCENKRKQNNEVVEKTTYTYRSLETEQLDLDYYAPKETYENLPLVVYVHGGGFANGSKNEKKIMNLAHKLAKHGYATIAISYRLTRANLGFDCETSAKAKVKAFNDASEDVSYAINYILENKSKFNIDTNKIVIAGESAGAEAILNLVYTYNNPIIPQNFKFAGIISRAGALTSLDTITTTSYTPMLLFHGDKDNLVPYNFGAHHGCNKNDKGYLNLFGSRAIANHLKQLNKPYYLVTLTNGNHGMHGFSEQNYFNEIINFLNTLNSTTKYEQIEHFY